MSSVLNYKGKLLVSKPTLYDDFFHRSVVLIVEDNDAGTLGFILNKSLEKPVSNFISTIHKDNEVFEGGPVNQKNIYYFHSRPDIIENSIHLFDNYYWSGIFKDIKDAVNAEKITKDEIKFFLGYSGWEKEQLHEEVNNKSWIVMKDNSINLLKKWDHNLWQRQLEKLGGENLIWINTPKDPMLN